MPPEEALELEQAVHHARERLDDLKPLMQMAHQLDRAADAPVYGHGEEDGSAA